MLSSYLICAAVFVGNLVAWTVYWRGFIGGQIAELTLSAGRMIMILTISTGLLAGLATLSPLEAILWSHLLGLANGRIGMLWAFCLTLLSLEIFYFRRVLNARPGAVNAKDLAGHA